jgi:hypothetical protein
MAITKIEFNSEGFREVLLSDGVHDIVQETADEIRDRANGANQRGGEGFTSNVIRGCYGGGRWIGFVRASDKNSEMAESEDKVLTGALL